VRPTAPGRGASQRPARHVRGRIVETDWTLGPEPPPRPGSGVTDRPEMSGRPTPPGNPPAPPTTLSLVISRRARREAAARAAQAQQAVDPRIETIEKVLAGLQAAGNVFVLALSAVGWLWLAAQREGRAQAAVGRATGGTDQLADSTPAGTFLGHLMPQSLVTASGATLVVIMLATCLLLAPVVNPFYAPPERRALHTATTALFGLLALTTVAVIAGAAN
jgi:hypothetical protein